MTDNYEYMHKAVIALNNTGVSLIDHGLYHGAIETLKDSMRLMKGFVHMKNDRMKIPSETLRTTHTSSSTATANRMDYDAAIQAACRRKTLIHHRKNEDVTKNQNVLVISEHDHPCTVFDYIVQHPAQAQHAKPLLCCVTIDLLSYDDDDECDSHRLQQESALILYNLSIAYKCLANDSSLSSTSTDCHRISFHLMEYAYTVLCSVLQSISTCGDLLMNVSLNLFLITFLILNNLQEMSLENSLLRDKHVHYSVAYEHIVTAMAERFMHTAEEEIQMFLGAAAA